jgi:hypothetical protein
VQRRARTYVTGVSLVVTLSMGLTACSGSSDDGTGADSKRGTSTSAAPPAEPGKYSTLPDPCDAVGVETLKRLLPGAEAAAEATGGKSPDASASPFEGDPTVTYDTDRRAGCRWKSATSLATRHLSVDLERVVSYDPAVSDDEQAQQVYDERASSAGFPTGGDGSSSPPESEQGEQGGPSEKDGQSTKDEKKPEKATEDAEKNAAGSEKPDSGKDPQPADEEEEAAGASPSPEEELAPRILDDIGDNAYIDDQLDTSDSGVHRDITLVFRSANVLVTVKYDQWLTDKRRSPDSAELQEKARSVAEELAADFDAN